MNKINIILIGNQGSGKTSVVNKFLYQDIEDDDPQKAFTHLYYPTIGINLERKAVKLKDNNNEEKEVNLHIWDTAGQEKFFSLTKNFFQRADGVAVIYDITDPSSFSRIEDYWLGQVNDNCKPTTVKILIGNKMDLEEHRQITYEAGASLAEKYQNLNFFETSAKTGYNVNEALMCLCETTYKTMCKQLDEEQKFSLNNKQNSTKIKFDCWDKLKETWSKFRKQKD